MEGKYIFSANFLNHRLYKCLNEIISLFFLLTFLFVSSAFAETIFFDMFLFGDKIGVMTVSLETKTNWK